MDRFCSVLRIRSFVGKTLNFRLLELFPLFCFSLKKRDLLQSVSMISEIARKGNSLHGFI